MLIKKALKFICKTVIFLNNRTIFKRIIPDKWYLYVIYYFNIGKRLHLTRPQSFNEKVQWLKVYDYKNNYSKYVDKYEVRKYISKKFGEDILIPLIGGPWDNFDSINFDELPNKFILKCTHDSGGNYICLDKKRINIYDAKSKITKSLKKNYYWYGREKVYKYIKPRIIAEEYLVGESGEEIQDYKMLVFNGKVKCSYVGSERFSSGSLKMNFYDVDWNEMPFERKYRKSNSVFKKPNNYYKMIEISEEIAKYFDFIRVDFYDNLGKMYFGEITFYPGSGLERFYPDEWDYIIGKWLILGNTKKIRSIYI
jgi:hypothetical protein